MTRTPIRSALFERVLAAAARPLDAGHAFYLGYEMAKAATALTLAKDYRQDEALDWGFLTQPERHHRLKHSKAAASTDELPAAESTAEEAR